MKFRSDFVTNSSSSSFIIGKKDEEAVTIEFAYQKVKSYYNELYKKVDDIVDYINSKPKLNLEYIEEDYFCIFKFTKGKSWDDKNSKIRDAIYRDFGIDISDYFYKSDRVWLKECNTYKDYEKYWIDRMKKDNNYRVHAPFTIRSFTEYSPVNWLHFYANDEYYTDDSIGTDSDVLGWYYPYLEEVMKYNCDTCPNFDWCDKEECFDTRTVIKNIEFPEDKACLYLLGRVCIHSECGYIPDYVVEKLKKDAEYACNHMG